jgi:CRISPR-associated protein Cmr4
MQTTYQQGMVVLEDLAFQASADSAWSVTVDRLARFLPEGQAHNVYREKFRRDLVLIEDGDFCYLVQHATQVTARVKLNDHKTTTEDGGNLWYEETVPADTLFYALVRPERPRTTNSDLNGAAGVRAAILELLDGTLPFLQVGGNETVGHGWCAMRVVTGW